MFANVLAATLRNLVRNRLYAIIGVGGLAVAMAAALLAALFIHDELSFDRFIPGHERLYVVFSYMRAWTSGSDQKVGPALKQDFPQVQRFARVALETPGLRSGTVEANDAVAWVDPDFFTLEPLKAVAGDPRAAVEQADGVVLTRAMARKYFGRDAPIGETLQFGRKTPMRVRAVIEDLPSNSNVEAGVFASGRSAISMFVQMEKLRPLMGEYSDFFRTYVQLRDPRDAAAINAAMPGFVERRLVPPSARAASLYLQSLALKLTPVTAMHMQPDLHAELAILLSAAATRPGKMSTLWGLGAVAGLILAVAAANFVNLQTARGARRATEVGVRKASGATRGQLLAQFLGESVLYALLALVLALALAEIALPVLQGVVRRPIAFTYWRDPGMAAFAVGLALLLGVLAGAYPAVVMSAFRPAAVLKDGLFQATGARPVRLVLVVGQFVVLIALLVGLLGIYAQTRFALNEATGFDKEGLLRVQMPDNCHGVFADRVRALPGVASAACSSGQAIGISGRLVSARLIDGRTTQFNVAPIDYGFFETYGIKPLAGALPTVVSGADAMPADAPSSACYPRAAVVNAAAAPALGFRDARSMTGAVITLACGKAWSQVRVLGVMPNINYNLTRGPAQPTLYPVDRRQFVTLNVKIRAGQVPATVAAIDQAWAGSGQPHAIRRAFAADGLLRSYADVITQGELLGALAGVTAVIACLGVFALAAFTAERRTKEIGVRKVMGASSRQIALLLLWSLAQPVLWANLIAWPLGGFLLQRWLQGFAARISLSPTYFLAAGGAAAAIALITVAFEALRVSRAEPARALRYE
jgi:putative ABC transport system permease protein